MAIGVKGFESQFVFMENCKLTNAKTELPSSAQAPAPAGRSWYYYHLGPDPTRPTIWNSTF